MKNINEIICQATNTINRSKARSAWARGVREYALDLMENLNQYDDIDPYDLTSRKLVERYLLNGASDWTQYSCGGCALIYDRYIARRLCTASELKRTRDGQRNPNARETWLDVQARALYQAARLAEDAIIAAAQTAE